jgi:estrogen-related receptor beta like 1
MTTIESSIEPEAWQLELERVLPQLKLQVVSDGKEWRTHIAQAKAHHEAVASKLPGSTGARVDSANDSVRPSQPGRSLR